MHSEWTDLLSSYLDGELDLDSRRRLEAHLAQCESCRAVRVDLSRIVAAAPEYRGEPPRIDRWPGVAAEIDRGRVTTLSTRPRFSSPAVGWLMAAGLVAAVGLGLWWRRVPEAPPSEVAATRVLPASGSPVLPAAFESKAYDTAVAELERTLAERRGSLDSATVRVLQQSLATIDRAIAEARAAVQRDTSNGYLNDQIAGNLRKKLNVLRLATRALASET